MSSTQDVLEELAFKADGGFCEDAGEATTEAATAAAATAECGSNATSNLVADWSLFVDNPTLSDVQVRLFGLSRAITIGNFLILHLNYGMKEE